MELAQAQKMNQQFVFVAIKNFTNFKIKLF